MESESSQRSGGGGSGREQGAGGVRETGEERARSGISTIGGKQDGNSKRQAFVVCAYHSVKETNPTTTAPPPPPNYEIRTVPGLQTSFLFLSFVGSLAVSVFIVVFFFLLLPLPFLSVKGIF